jgi:hypothetical protein
MTAFDTIDQFERIKRSLTKITAMALHPGSNLVMGDPEPIDLVRVFFIECQNFKDYLKKDPKIANPEMVESFIDGSPMLKLCIDIGNAFKHAGLDKKSRSGMKLAKINHAHTLIMPPYQADAKVGTEIIVTFDNNKYKANEIAIECVNEWARFLRSANII